MSRDAVMKSCLIHQPTPTGFLNDVFSTDSAAATLSDLINCQAITRHHQTALP
jgi:hypothetical protein